MDHIVHEQMRRRTVMDSLLWIMFKKNVNISKHKRSYNFVLIIYIIISRFQ